MFSLNLKECIDRLRNAGADIPPQTHEAPFSRVNVLHIHENFTSAERRAGKDGTDVEAGTDDEKTARLKQRPVGILPPWGTMPDNLLAEIPPLIPLDFKLADGTEPTSVDYAHWLAGVVSDIDSLIWPKYVAGINNWTDATVGALCDADFKLLCELRHNFWYPIKGAIASTVLNGDLFAEEDNSKIAFGSDYGRYDLFLDRVVMEAMPSMVTAGIANKVGSVDLQLKCFFQRPRAYQVAFMQGRKYTYESANTANSPSLVSGHCLQASLGGCTAFDALRDKLNSNSIEILQQFTVDVGDRRVFAGVHYPSDNLASWLTAFNLLPHVFAADRVAAVRKFLWAAINTKSTVFQAILRDGMRSPYGRILEALTKLGSGDAKA